MNRLSCLLLSAGAVLALSGTSSAADPVLPVPVLPVAPVAAAHDWSGFYAGVNAGYGWAEAYDGTGAVVGAGTAFPANSVNGLLGGAQLGANFQRDAVVFGVEADIQASGMNQTMVPGGSISVDYFGTVRGRLGVEVGNGVLPYLTAGLAYGQGRVDAGVVPPGIESHFHLGWTAGGGVEFKAGDQISVKGEYLYTDLGVQNYFVGGPGGQLGLRFHTVRAGVNFHF